MWMKHLHIGRKGSYSKFNRLTHKEDKDKQSQRKKECTSSSSQNHPNSVLKVDRRSTVSYEPTSEQSPVPLTDSIKIGHTWKEVDHIANHRYIRQNGPFDDSLVLSCTTSASQISIDRMHEKDASPLNNTTQEFQKKPQRQEEPDTTREKITKYEEELQGLQSFKNEIKRQIKSNANALEREREQLEKLGRVREPVHAFAGKESTRDAQTLIQSFIDLNLSISDFAHEVLRSLDPSIADQPMEEGQYDRVFSAFSSFGIGPFLRKASRTKDLTPLDIVDLLVCYLLCFQLWMYIYHPFCPGLPPDIGDRFVGVYNSIQETEPQESSAHWRSLTFRALSQLVPENHLQNGYQEFLSMLGSILFIFSNGKTNKPRDSFSQAAMKIFANAIEVQRVAKTEYFSFDYNITFPLVGSHFDTARMSAHQSKGRDAKEVMMTVGFGVEARKNVIKEDGRNKFQSHAAIKATVVTDNWDPDG